MKPNKNNTNLGDLLAIADNNEHILLPIIKTDEKGITANKGNLYAYRKYDDAFVLKNNNNYLIGDEIKLESDKLVDNSK